MDKADFERRLVVEREIEKNWDYSQKAELNSNAYLTIPSIGFDESDQYLYFGSLMGIKVIHIRTKALARIVGKVESTERFI